MVFECFFDALEPFVCRFHCKEWKQFGSFHVMHRSENEFRKSWLNPHKLRKKYLSSLQTSQNIFSQHRFNFWSESFQEALTKLKTWPNSLDDHICVEWNFENILICFFFPSLWQNHPGSALYCVKNTFQMVIKCFRTVCNHIFQDFIAQRGKIRNTSRGASFRNWVHKELIESKQVQAEVPSFFTDISQYFLWASSNFLIMIISRGSHKIQNMNKFLRWPYLRQMKFWKYSEMLLFCKPFSERSRICFILC